MVKETIDLELDPEAQRAAELAELARLDAEEDGELFRVTDEMASTDNVRLIFTRVWPNEPGQKGFVGEMSPAEFTLERAERAYGPGRYKVRVMGPKGFLKGGGTLNIANKPKSNLNDPVALLDELDRRNKERESGKRGQALEYITALAPIIAPLVAKMVGGNNDIPALIAALKPPPAPTMPELMTALASLKSLAPEQTSDPVDRALKIMDAIGEKGGGGGETNWTDVFKELVRAVGPNIGGVLEGAMQRSQGMAVASVPATKPALSGPLIGSDVPNAAMPIVPGASTSFNGGDNMLLQLIPWLRTQAAMLNQKAARGSDPALYAEVLLDSLPEGVSEETVYQFLKRPDWFNYVLQLSADAKPYQGWYERLKEAALQAFTWEDEQSPPGVSSGRRRQIDATHVEVQGPASTEAKPLEMPTKPPSLTGE